jgi:hypothetical protein
MTVPSPAGEHDLDAYYASEAVRARIVESCGGTATTAPTAAYVVALGPHTDPPSWDTGTRVPATQLHTVWASRSDLARSLWDARHLLFFLEIDYQNIDAPAEPFVHPADVFLKLESAYQAVTSFFHHLSFPLRAVATGRGYHFIGQMALDDPLVQRLADVLPDSPAWYADVERRRPPGVTAPLTETQARAWAGLGCLLEYAAHEIRAGVSHSPLPIVFNGTIVGNRGLVGRECASIDFSHAGDPLDVRHVRTAFSTYQWHRLRPDIFGARAAADIQPTAVVPRRSLLSILTGARDLDSARRTAPRVRASVPDVARPLQRLLAAYMTSPLADFHRAFYADLQSLDVEVPAIDLAQLPPCVAASLTRPNDLLLKPEHIQHLVRGLMSRGWPPAQIARLVQRAYEEDHGWGDRFHSRMCAQTRAEFDVRVFAGLIATGADALIDFNCVSAQEKDLCPHAGCRYDLRTDRERLTAQAL